MIVLCGNTQRHFIKRKYNGCKLDASYEMLLPIEVIIFRIIILTSNEAI